MCGMVPFGEDCEDPWKIYTMIISQAPDYPPFFLSQENKFAKKLINQLLNKTPEARLGGSYAALKTHPWFEDLDWVKS